MDDSFFDDPIFQNRFQIGPSDHGIFAGTCRKTAAHAAVLRL